MNRVNLELLDKQNKGIDINQEYLKQYGLDDESVKEFRSKIKKVSQEEADRLGNIILRATKCHLIPTKERDYALYSNMFYRVMEGANVNYRDLTGDSIMGKLIRYSLFYSTILLLKAGANINTLLEFCNTPLMLAIQYNNIELVKILLLLGADIIYKSKNGFEYDALNCAVANDNKECIKILEDAMQGKNIITEDDIKHAKKELSLEGPEENIINDKTASKKLSELTPEELLQEAEINIQEVSENVLIKIKKK